MKSTSIFHRGMYALLDSVTIAIFNVVYVVSVVRSIPKDEYGTLVLCDSIRVFLIMFGDLAVGQGLIKYASEKAESELAAVVTHVLFLKLILTCFSSIILLLFAHGIAMIFHVPRLAVLLYWVPLLLFAVLLNYFLRQLLTARQHLKQVFWIDLGVFISFLIVFTIAKITGHLTNGVNVLWILTVSYFLGALPGLWFARHLLRLQTNLQMDWLKRISRFAWFSFINSAGVQIYSKIDLFMLAYFSSPLNVAVYNVAHLFTNLSTVINDSINSIVFPVTAKIDLSLGEISKNRIRQIYESSSGILFLMALPVALILFLFPEQILHVIYAGKYQEAAPIVRVFAFWGLMHPFYRIAASVFNGIGRPEINARLTWFGVGINILVNLLLIPILGALGAAITALVTTAVILVIYLVLLRKQFAIRPLYIDFQYLKKIVAGR